MIDWTKPIEAVHVSSGMVVPMVFEGGPDDNGDYWTETGPGPDSNCFWKANGADCCPDSAWGLRNRAELDPAITPAQMVRIAADKALRDRFAIAALTGFIAEQGFSQALDDASWIWEIADAMMKARAS